jgi:hypothetical protein
LLPLRFLRRGGSGGGCVPEHPPSLTAFLASSREPQCTHKCDRAPA